MQNGAIGCSMSHLKIIETAKANDWEHVLIIEDDILFTNPVIFINHFNKFLSKHKDFDVVLIAGNNLPPYNKIDDTCIQVTHCQTTTGYLVQKHYYDTLIKNYKDGILHLMKDPNNHRIYAIDKYWFNLQTVDKWYLIVPLTVTQREDYSDIERRPTNYTPAMLDLDKVAFLQRQKDIAALRNIGFLNFK
jgi:glycosyl transferase family 25